MIVGHHPDGEGRQLMACGGVGWGGGEAGGCSSDGRWRQGPLFVYCHKRLLGSAKWTAVLSKLEIVLAML